MNKVRLIVAAGAGMAWAATVLALPPRNVNPDVNKQEAVQECLSTCTAHAKAPAACSAECRKIFLPIYGPVQGLDTSDANVNGCLASEAGVWAWYAACQVDLTVLTDGVTASLATLLNNAAAAQKLMGAAKGLGDPCGYVKDQLLAQNAAQCPASPLLPKTTAIKPR